MVDKMPVNPAVAHAPRILGLGDCTIDIYVDRGIQYPGGNALNVPVLMSRQGAQAAFLGCVGNDALAPIIVNAAQAEGVDLSRLRICGTPTAWSRIRHVGSDRVFDGSRPEIRGRYQLDDATLAWISEFDLIHTSIYSLIEDDLPPIRRALGGRGGRFISFDFSDEWDDAILDQIGPHIDLAFLSANGRNDAACRDLLDAVAERGPQVVVVTRGPDGAVALSHGTVASQRVVEGDVRDTLGAGDGFIAGFLGAYLRDKPLHDILQAGAELAGAVCSWDGAFGHGVRITPGQPGLVRPQSGEQGLRAPGAPLPEISKPPNQN